VTLTSCGCGAQHSGNLWLMISAILAVT